MPRFPSHNTVKSLHTQSVAKSHAYHLKPRAGHHQHAKGFGTLVVPQFQNPVDESQAKLTPPHTSQNKTQSFQNLQSSHVKEALCGLENLISFLSFGSNLEVLDFSEQVLSSKLIAAQALILHFEATGGLVRATLVVFSLASFLLGSSNDVKGDWSASVSVSEHKSPARSGTPRSLLCDCFNLSIDNCSLLHVNIFIIM
nr:hypothetical protein Iba_chr02eCG7250 [Ipomoea batatas]